MPDNHRHSIESTSTAVVEAGDDVLDHVSDDGEDLLSLFDPAPGGDLQDLSAQPAGTPNTPPHAEDQECDDADDSLVIDSLDSLLNVHRAETIGEQTCCSCGEGPWPDYRHFTGHLSAQIKRHFTLFEGAPVATGYAWQSFDPHTRRLRRRFVRTEDDAHHAAAHVHRTRALQGKPSDDVTALTWSFHRLP